MSRRSESLRAVAEDFVRVHHEWANDQDRAEPDEAYWDAADDLFEAFAAGDIPADCRKLADAVAKLLDEDARFALAMDTRGATYPHHEFWAAREAVEAALKASEARELRPLEPIAELRRQGVDDRQIAKMWGFVNRRGEEMPWLVQEEIDKPGSITKTRGAMDGRDWEDPRLRDLRESEGAGERHAEGVMRRRARKAESANADEPKPCPETPKELWEQGVSPEQSAAMLRRPLDEVKALWLQFERAAGTPEEQPETTAVAKRQSPAPVATPKKRGRPRKVGV